MKKAAVCSEKLPSKAVKKLSENFDRVWLLPAEKKLSAPVCHHPDMILSIVGKRLFCHEDYLSENRELLCRMCSELSLEPTAADCRRGDGYPFDVAFNVFVASKYAFCNKKYTSEALLRCAREEGLEAVNVKQGYAACSSLYINGTVISADPSILKAAEGKTRTLEVKGGGIRLDPYDTGFIGGAAGFFDNVLYTFGELDSFKGAEVLTDFLEKEKISLCPLFEGELTDFGGIIFITY